MRTTMAAALLAAGVLLMPGDPGAWEKIPEDVRILEQVPHPDWCHDLSIYEVNLRQYTPEGTFAAFREHLPRLKDMGIGILWFMPIHPIGEENRKGTLGSYYSVKDYQAVNPELGTFEEFRELVREIHALDMYVLIDWVANHCAWDNAVVEEHPDWITRDEKGQPQPPVADWHDVVDFDYSQPGLHEWMTQNLEFWIREADIDGYRCDVAGMVPTEFWDSARPRLEAIKPVFMLAEWADPRLHPRAFNMSYGWGVHRAMNDIAQGKRAVAGLDEELALLGKFPPEGIVMHFITNHDENSWNGTVYERMGAAAEAFAVLSYTLPGMPLVYSGQEAGLDKRLEFFEKDLIPWKPTPWEELFTVLNTLKREHEALWHGGKGGELQRLDAEGETVYAFQRSSGSSLVRVTLNLGTEAQEPRLPGLPGGRRLVFSSAGAEETSTSLPAWGWRVEAVRLP